MQRILAAMAGVLATASAHAQEIRPTVELATGWSFHQGDVKGLPDQAAVGEGWVPVSVPHTWNRVGNYLPNPQSQVNRPQDINKYQGVSWYRLVFNAPATFVGKRAWLQFDAASRTAEVWLNGQRLGEHRGGFSRFRLEATNLLKVGGQNTLLVRVDNTVPKLGGPTADTLPLRGDFFIHGGLYRPVSLIATEEVHIDMADAGGPGIYGSTRTISKGQALVDVRARLRNEGAAPARVTARLRLLDHAGKLVAEDTRTLDLANNGGSEVAAALRVANPHLWNGTADPYLHRLVVEVIAADGTVLDRKEQPFGIREIRINPTKGFFLNGRPLKLHGVGYHQDRAGKGTAITPADVEEDVRIMREMGVNSIRLTHYQHGQIIHDLADKYGLILWDEIPLVTAWTLGDAKDATPEFKANARQQLRELIRQNYNHPSVVTWGIANEVDFGNSMPMFLVAYKDGTVPDPMPLLRELNALAKSEDPGRPTTLATCCEEKVFDAGVEVPTTAEVTDLSGANRYFGWYLGKPEDLDGHLDRLHARRPQQPQSVTEYGAGGALTMHTDNVLGGLPDSRGRAQPEEYQSYVHEKNWATLAARPWLWGTWLWNSFDFATTIRREGDADDINTKGLVTYDRKVRKDAYYFYKANWTQVPMVHIAGRRYVDRAYPITDVRVYSNALRTELLLNGRSLGVRRNCPEKICVWGNVRLAPGLNRVIARGQGNGPAVEDSLEWQLSPEANRGLRIDSGALIAGKAQGGRFGSDAFFDGGTPGTIDVAPDYNRPAQRPAVVGTPDRDVAATFREGRFGYRIPLKNGSYTLTLTFLEPSAQPGARRFDVFADGKRVIAGLDIAAAAGAPLTAITRQVPVQVTNGRLDIRFEPIEGQAIVSSVEISL